jgi:excisionase family DNA binding protein
MVCSQIAGEAIAGGGQESQALVRIGGEAAAGSQAKGIFTAVSKDFATAFATGPRPGRSVRETERRGFERRRGPGEPELLTVREVAARLRVSSATVYRMCALGVIPSVRILNSIRVWAAAIGGPEGAE